MSSQYTVNHLDKSFVITRVKFLMFVIGFVFVALIMRIIDLAFTNIEEIEYATNIPDKNKNIVSRADIIDRNGVLLASNVRTTSVYAHPKKIINVQDAINKIASLGIGITKKDISIKLQKDKDFVWIKRHLTPEERNKIHALGIHGVYFTPDERRIYPQGSLFSHIIGYVDIDGNGIAGIERLLNAQLALPNPVQLSFDVRVQNIVRTDIAEAVRANEAIGGSGIVMDVNTGEIISMVSIPDFDQHYPNKTSQANLFNSSTMGVYEMGSTFKILTVAMGLDSNTIKVNDAFDVSKPLRFGRFEIHDYKGKGGMLSVPEILMYSSNLGIAQIAKLVGVRMQQYYLQKLGLLEELKGDIPEVARPLFPPINSWKEVSMTTISYGHGIAVTPIHLAQAFTAVVNGGTLHKATCLKKDALKFGDADSSIRVFKESTSNTIRKLLRLIVEKGYARKADVSGYVVGGKTGTAEKNHGGRYSKTLNIAFFIGAFPINQPKYMLLVMIDEGKPNSANAGRTTGGAIAAPVAGAIVKKIAPILGILPQNQNASKILQAMNIEYTPRYNVILAKH